MTTMPLTSITAREKRELEDIKRRCLTELEKAHGRNDRPTVKLLRYILEGATFGRTRRTDRPMVRGEWKKDSDYPWLLNCSVCGYSTERGTNYCLNCGAKMEDKANAPF